MRLNPDAVRAILLTIEHNTDYQEGGSYYNRPYFRDKEIIKGAITLFDLPEIELKYALELLIKTPYIELIGRPVMDAHGNLSYAKIKGITYEGADFLETIRPDTVWNAAKKKAHKAGQYSISAIACAAKLVAEGMLTNPNFLQTWLQ